MLRNKTQVGGVIWASLLKLQQLPLRYVSHMQTCVIFFTRIYVAPCARLSSTTWLKVFLRLLEENVSHWLLLCANCYLRRFLLYDSLANDRDKSREALIHHAVCIVYYRLCMTTIVLLSETQQHVHFCNVLSMGFVSLSTRTDLVSLASYCVVTVVVHLWWRLY